jgi:hypothetical protein
MRPLRAIPVVAVAQWVPGVLVVLEWWSAARADHPGAARGPWGGTAGAAWTTPQAVIWESKISAIVGTYCLAPGDCHGFKTHWTIGLAPSCCDWANDLQQITYPGATVTMVFDINEVGELVGLYYGPDGVHHGFIAIPSR